MNLSLDPNETVQQGAVTVKKTDASTGTTTQGDSSFAGVRFAIVNNNDNPVVNDFGGQSAVGDTLTFGYVSAGYWDASISSNRVYTTTNITGAGFNITSSVPGAAGSADQIFNAVNSSDPSAISSFVENWSTGYLSSSSSEACGLYEFSGALKNNGTQIASDIGTNHVALNCTTISMESANTLAPTFWDINTAQKVDATNITRAKVYSIDDSYIYAVIVSGVHVALVGTDAYTGRQLTQTQTALIRIPYTYTPPTGYLKVQKYSTNPSVSNELSCYSLSGVVMEVYSDSGCTNKVATLTTGSDGWTGAAELNGGTYYVRETKASANAKGWVWNSNAYSVTVVAGSTAATAATVSIPNTPATDPIGILLKKVDSESKENVRRVG